MKKSSYATVINLKNADKKVIKCKSECLHISSLHFHKKQNGKNTFKGLQEVR